MYVVRNYLWDSEQQERVVRYTRFVFIYLQKITMNVIQTQNSKEFNDKLELLLEDLDCQNLEQADEKLNSFFELEDVNDLKRVANCLNAMSDWIFFRVSKIWSEYETCYIHDVWVFTHIHCD